MGRRQIPYVKLGYRTLFFDCEKVREALLRFEIRAVGDDEPRGRKTTAQARQ